LWTGTLVNRLGAFVIPFLAIYLTTERGFSAASAGLVLGSYGAGGAVGVLLGGVLADRWGRRRTLLAAHLTTAAALLAMGFVRDLGPVIAAALLLGLAAEMSRPAFAAMMVDIVPEPDRLRAFTLNYWAINVGFASAAVLAGLAAQANFLLLFVVDAVTTVVTAGIIFSRVRETHPKLRVARAASGGRTPHVAGAGLRAVFADRVFVTFVALNVLLALLFMQHLSTLPIAMGQDGLSPATYGLVIALNGVLIVGGQLFVPRLVGGRDRSRVLALAAVVTGLGFGLTAVADKALLYALTVLIWTMGEMLNSPSSSTLIAELSPSELRGRYQGVFSLSWSVAAFAAPVMGGFVQEHVGTAALWLSCAGVGLVVAAGHLLSGPSRERRAAELRTTPAAVNREALAESAVYERQPASSRAART
jgi:MFS family permease